MAETLQQHEFIEIEYTGKFTDGTVFDTTDKKLAQQNNIYSSHMQYGSMIICLGEQQLIEGLDKGLLGKEIGQTYTFDIKPEQAFGKKDIKQVRLIPLAEFTKRDIEPHPGLQIDLDGELGTVLRATGGRIMVNFNHPFAGKEVVYEVKVNRKVTDKKEQINAYLKVSFNLPGIETEVHEDKAIITLPIEVPELFQEPIIKKIKELTQIKEIIFKSKPQTTSQ